MWHRRGSPHAIHADTMVLVRAMMPVRGVVHGQTANPFGCRGRNPGGWARVAAHAGPAAWAFGGRG